VGEAGAHLSRAPGGCCCRAAVEHARDGDIATCWQGQGSFCDGANGCSASLPGLQLQSEIGRRLTSCVKVRLGRGLADQFTTVRGGTSHTVSPRCGATRGRAPCRTSALPPLQRHGGARAHTPLARREHRRQAPRRAAELRRRVHCERTASCGALRDAPCDARRRAGPERRHSRHGSVRRGGVRRVASHIPGAGW
jgi:hypothetical protein